MFVFFTTIGLYILLNPIGVGINLGDIIMIDLLDLLNIATAVVAACSAIAAMTPTPTDDSMVAKAYKIVDMLAINVGKAKE